MTECFLSLTRTSVVPFFFLRRDVVRSGHAYLYTCFGVAHIGGCGASQGIPFFIPLTQI